MNPAIGTPPPGPFGPYGIMWMGTWEWMIPDFADQLVEIEDAGAYWTPETVTAWRYIGHDRIVDEMPEDPSPQQRVRLIVRDEWNVATHSNQYGNRTLEHHDPAPLLACTCGYYSFKTSALAVEYVEDHYHDKDHDGCTYGSAVACDVWKVEYSGIIIQHEHGYRGQKMRLVEKVKP